MLTQEALMQYQKDSEEESRGLGIIRYRDAIQRDQANTPPGRQLMRKAVMLLTPVINDYIQTALVGVASRSAGVVYYLGQFEPDLLALVTATQCISGMALPGASTRRQSVQHLAHAIAVALEDTVNHELLKETDPRIYRRLQAAIRTKGNDHYRHVVLRKYQEHAQVKSIQWNRTVRTRLGLTLIHLFCEGTGLAVIDQRWKDTSVLCPTTETDAWLLRAHTYQEAFCSVARPMVVAPRPWTAPRDGGYLTWRLPVVKTRNAEYLRELAHVDLTAVYGALNALQATAWAINPRVYDVMMQAWDTSSPLGGLPSRDNAPLPAQHHDPETDVEAHREWKRLAARVHEANEALRSDRYQTALELGLARRYREANIERFWLAYQLDWRGRMYPITDLLSPQGRDRSKGLIRFADGVALGVDGAYWLAVHGANCAGVDKVTFDERVQWVEDNESHILASAADPLGHAWWAVTAKDDNPWQLLAFCLEWSALVLHEAMGGEREAFVSHLPVGLDGSCNGLQNFSMLLRDEIGGAATNLVPQDRPADIYTAVATEAGRVLECEMGDDGGYGWSVWGPVWADPKVARKLAKQPTMTMPYGSGQYGFKDQLMAVCAERNLLDPQVRFLACLRGAKAMHTAISRVVVKAAEAMTWLQEVSAIVAKDGKPITWVTPSGLPVLQRYMSMEGTTVDAVVAGRRYTLTLQVEGMTLDKAKQRAGIAPNFIHSLDAAHLVRTVNRCAEEGIKSFAMVHDSYGTHAGNIGLLAWELRDAFVRQYTPDLLAEFRDEVLMQISDAKLRGKLPPLPAYGSLDVQAVLQSEYFFA